jgi:hypothetical protein
MYFAVGIVGTTLASSALPSIVGGLEHESGTQHYHTLGTATLTVSIEQFCTWSVEVRG